MVDVLYGGLSGFALAFVTCYVIFKGLRRVPLKSFFNITGGLILFVAAGLLSNMIGIMQDIGLAPFVYSPVFNLSWLMDDSSEVGIFFKALFGYTSSPGALQIAAYTAYLSLVSTFLSMDRKSRPEKRCPQHYLLSPPPSGKRRLKVSGARSGAFAAPPLSVTKYSRLEKPVERASRYHGKEEIAAL